MAKNKTAVVKFSEANVLNYQKKSDITFLRDPRYPLKLRFLKGRLKASWYFIVYRNNKIFRRKIGTWPSLTVKGAISGIPELSRLTMADPNFHGDHGEFEYVSDLLLWYAERSFKLKSVSKQRKATIKSVINCHLRPRIGAIKLYDLQHYHVDSLLIIPLQEIRKPATVMLAFRVLKAAFNKALKLKMIKENAVSAMVYSDFIVEDIKEKPCKISPYMLPDLFIRLKLQPVPVRMLVILMLAHATRLGETRRIRWKYIDLNAAVMILPAEITKTNVEHEIPLSDLIVCFLKAYKKRQRYYGYWGDFLFQGKSSSAPICSSTATKKIKDFSRGEFTAHDFRKLAGDLLLGQMQIDYMVVKLIFNHKMSNVDKAYFKTLTTKPNREALIKYHSYLGQNGLDPAVLLPSRS